MAILINDNTARVQYTATSGQTVFAVPFEFFENSDLKVYRNSTLQTITTHYTLTGAGVTGGGNLTFVSGVTLNDIITIVRDIPIKRVTDFPLSGPFNITALNLQLDQLTAMIQEVNTLVTTRVPLLSEFDQPSAFSALPTRANRANNYFVFDSNGNPAVASSALAVTNFTQAGTGAVLRTVQDKMREYISAADFGAVGDGVTDDAPAINLALAEANARGGGVVQLLARTYLINSPLDIKYPRVILLGSGIDAQHDGGSATTRTQIKANFAGTMLRIRTPYAAEMGGVAQQKYWGAGAKGLFLNCNLIATRAMVVDSVSGVEVDVFGQGCVGTSLFEVTCGVSNTDLAEAADVQFSRMVFRGRQIDNVSERSCHILTLEGSSNANVSLNRGPNHGITVFCQHYDGHALNAVAGDNNDIVVAGFRPAGTGNLVYAKGLTATNEGFYANDFVFVSGAGAIFAEGTDTAGVITPVQNSVLNLDQANSTPAPTVGTGSNWSVRETRGIFTGTAHGQTVFADTVANAASERANISNNTVRIRNGSDGHVALTDGTNTWGINITSANGNLRIVRLTGSGLINLAGNTQLGAQVGFQGTAPIAKPTVTGSRGGNAALASLLTALANYGLITDSTTA